MASLSYLQPYLVAAHDKAVQFDVPSPVIDALLALLEDLNAPRSSYHSIRPLDIIEALVDRSPGKHNSLFSSREHQDAQELFQLVSECVKKEVAAVNKEHQRDRGLGGFSQLRGETNQDIGMSVFDGLTANRRSCMLCGYTEAVMHFAFDSWQLAVPRYTASCRLEDCLAEYTKLEMLTDCICRKCSVVATHEHLTQEVDRLEKLVNADPEASIYKKRRADARKLELRVRALLEHGRLEEDVRGVRMEKVFSRATKQAMIARSPLVLALHLNRSLSYGQFAMKNSIRVVFPEILDLTPFMTSGSLSTVPSVPISFPPPNLPRSTTPTQAMYSTPRTIYRLSAVVCHYGQHSFGHYVCFRRKPRPPSCGATRYAPPRFAHPLGCECEKCFRYGNIRDDDDAVDSMHRPGRGWLCVSDDSVKECGIESVLQEGSGAFMLYYERVVQSRPGIYPLHSSPRSSEETLRPKLSTEGANGSTASLVSMMDLPEGRERSVYGARIVRSVVAGRGSASAAPSERGSSKDRLPNGNGSVSSSAILPNGNASYSSLTLKASMFQTSPSSVTASSLKPSALSASVPDLRDHSVSIPSSHSSSSLPHHHQSPVQPSLLKA
ncbi:cysteine proteinase [Gyrodon lividus]|nr:cysteine proteinase [Gyrodon lividus]